MLHYAPWSGPIRREKKICTGVAWESTQTGRMEIKVFNNNVEKALKVAKKKLAGEGLFRELKRRRFYEKPSVRKKAKQREAQRRRQKWLSKRKPE
jgi:small subunit ribosomal protein S21